MLQHQPGNNPGKTETVESKNNCLGRTTEGYPNLHFVELGAEVETGESISLR